MIVSLDHIAIAVPNLHRAIKRFTEDFNLEFDGCEDVEEALTSTAFFPLTTSNMELVCPLNGQGPIAKYLEKKPGGIHHICFRSNDLVADVERLKKKGYNFLTDKPQLGAHDTQVIFIHPKSCDGVLVELSQPAIELQELDASPAKLNLS